jgi:hypothetical protein
MQPGCLDKGVCTKGVVGMGKSLFGQLKGVLSREKKSSIAVPASQPSSSANLSRIGLAGAATPAAPAGQQDFSGFSPAPSVDMGFMAGEAMPGTAGGQIAGGQIAGGQIVPVGIQFMAEVPLQQSAEEIVNVSRRATNCMDANLMPAADNKWNVIVTLSMQPVPQHIHEVETLMADWAGKLGGISKGWGLAQGHAA